MGGGSWSAAAYDAGSRTRAATGKVFAYDKTVRSTGLHKAHTNLDPKRINAAGLNIRESRDFPGKANSVPIVVGLDVTGSMASTPRVVQDKLATLFGLIVRKGYVDGDPQVSIAAYGDAYTDSVPLQIGNFEADNRIEEESLNNLYLEGNGGGNSGETQTLLWYYLNNHVETDAWTKRGKKGYLFVIADEVALDLKPGHVKDFIGDTEPVGDLTTEYLAKKVQEKWEVIILLIDNSTAHWQKSEAFYTKLFGKNHVIVVENPDTISETIGAALGVLENDDIDDAELEADLIDEGANAAVAGKTVAALARLERRGNSKSVVAQGNVNLDVDDEDLNIL